MSSIAVYPRREENCKIKTSELISTMAIRWLDFCFQVSRGYTALQLIESLHWENKVVGIREVDAGKVNRQVVPYVSYFPARAAVRGAIRSVGSAADKREAGNSAKRWVFPDKIWARNVVEGLTWVVIYVAVYGFVLRVRLHGCWSQESKTRENIMTNLCHGTTDLGEEEGKNKCSEEDHCDLWKRRATEISRLKAMRNSREACAPLYADQRPSLLGPTSYL